MPITGLSISDVTASAETGMMAAHTSDMELHDVQVDAINGPAFLARHSRELEFDSVSTHHAFNRAPVIRLENCPGTIIRDSRAFAGTRTFLSVGPGELKDVILTGNAISNAQKPVVEETSGTQ